MGGYGGGLVLVLEVGGGFPMFFLWKGQKEKLFIFILVRFQFRVFSFFFLP